MKAISISKEQKKKLIEMCKSLFPEYYFQNSDGFTEENCIYFFKKEKEEEFEILSIHWFKFCCKILPEKILNKGSLSEHVHNNVTDYLYQAILFDNEHPVDYLYKEFKKLK